MKKLFLAMAAFAALFTSCSKDDTFGGPTRGKVTFEVSTPELATRYGEGEKATKLYYAVYDMVENTTDGVKVHESTATLTNGAVAVPIDLVEGRKYTAIFWADADTNSSPYKFDAATKTVSYKDNFPLTANNENYDAFFAFVPEAAIKVGQTVDVDLTRPFAQLNIATNDTEKAQALQVVVENTAVTVAGVYTSFNLATGLVQGEPTTVTFASAEKANGTIGTAPNTYDLLSMNYVLVNSEKLVDVTLNFTDDVNGTEQSYVRQYNKVKVQRNYRTNIVGSILTDETIFDVDIEEGFLTPDKDVNGDNSATQTVSTATEIQAAINGAADGEETTIVANSDIVLGADTRASENPYGLLIPAGKIITLDLNGFTLSWENGVQNCSMIQNNGNLTINNGNVVYTYSGENDSNYGKGNYAINNSGTLTVNANITVMAKGVSEGMKFSHAMYAIHNSGATTIDGGVIFNPNGWTIRQWIGSETNSSDITINGGEIKGMRPIWMQLPNSDTTKAPLANLTINGGKLYSLGESEEYKLAIYCTSQGNQVKNVKINIAGGEFVGDIALTGGRGDNKVDVESLTITGGKFNGGIYSYADAALAAKSIAISGGTFHDASVFNFLADSAEEINITMAADMEVPISSFGQQTSGSGEYKLGGENTKKITIDLNSHKLNITTTYWSAIGAKNNDALITIKNGKMTSTGNSAGTWNAWDLRFSNCNYAFEDVEFEKAVALDNVGKSTSMKNVTITDTHDTDTYGLWITAEGQTVTLEDCVIDMIPASDGRGIKIDEQYVDAPAKVTLNVKGVTFKTEEKAAILVKSAAGAEINASNLNIEGVAADKVFAVWVDEDAAAHADKVVVNGAQVRVENAKVEEVVGVGTAEDLKAALESLMAGNMVVLEKDIDLTGVEWAVTAPWSGSSTEVVFDGAGHKITGLTTDGTYGGLLGKFNSNGNITIKNLILEDVTITGNNTGEESAGGALIGWIENHGGQTITIENVKVNGIKAEGFKFIGGLIGYNNGNVAMNLTGCSVTGATDSYLNSTYNESGNYKGHVGGLLGLWMKGELTNCEVKNIAIKHGTTDMTGSSNRAGALVGTKYSGVTVTSATVENVTVDGVAATVASLFGPGASSATDTDKSNVTIK